MSERRRATIQDVADRAGVSKMTVSRVLNDDPKVSDKTRQKVQQIANELNYRPNVSARRLASSKSYFIGLLYDNPSEGYISQFLLGALKSCRAKGYHLVVDEASGESEQQLQITRSLIEETRVDGVILLPPVCDQPEVIEVLKESGVPFIRVAPDTQLDCSPYVCMDDYQAAFEMTQLLINKGHTEIGFIIGNPNQGASRLRYQGYMDALRSNKLAIVPETIEQGYFTYKSGLSAAEKILTSSKRPTAVFASNDDMAAATISVANRLQIKVPDELSVVGYDDTHIAQALWPPLTTVRQPIAEMANRAVELLSSGQVSKERKPKASEYRQVLDFELKSRDSVISPT
ncbi:LacI family DNA-binding transcriptional regulator [Paraferrimonas sedimenticola]|uniref:LacI family transcriptional regulator n=1 Tax=Paraferrimonas sedimenticola TaxID=375674 RepID=A0AA37W0S8_9GAMM|nr:LacI family DNA-binding transcriptional regulator [Paraferrimonas sedimenticola]GLP95908.1 LacI family transcriptional regulator [Paraferrimonas sedimenticola]